MNPLGQPVAGADLRGLVPGIDTGVGRGVDGAASAGKKPPDAAYS